MTLSDPLVAKAIEDRYIVGWYNISTEPYAGKSGDHKPDFKAEEVNNGSGPHNVQIFFLAPDGTVLHALPGVWRADALLHEMKLAEALYQLYRNKGLSREDKAERFTQAQLAHTKTHSRKMHDDSEMQGFDKWEETNKKDSDFTAPGVTRTVDQVVHLRMSKRPFVPYDTFDIANYVDYGKKEYDAHSDDRAGSEQTMGTQVIEALEKLQKRAPR